MPTVSAFWADHVVSRREAARMVSSVLVKVASIDPLLESWRERGRTSKQALEQPTIDMSAAGIEALLQVSRRDLGGDEIPDLGFSMGAWNGTTDSGDQAGVSVTSGSMRPLRAYANSFVFRLPTSWEDDDPRLHAVAETLVEHLVPDEVLLFGDDRSEVLWPR